MYLELAALIFLLGQILVGRQRRFNPELGMSSFWVSLSLESSLSYGNLLKLPVEFRMVLPKPLAAARKVWCHTFPRIRHWDGTALDVTGEQA
jgi:hypothetical protein